MRVFYLLLAALLALNSFPAIPAPRSPTEQWIVSFDAAQCLAQRNYGTKEKPINLVVKQPPIGDVVQLAVSRDRSAGEPVQYEGSIRFDNGQPIKLNVLEFRPRKGNAEIYLFNVPTKDFLAVRRAKSLKLSSSGFSEEFALSSIGPLMKVMDECVADLRRVWNINEKGSGPSTAINYPERDLRGLFRPDDYPTAALNSVQGGTVAMVVLIDEKGRVQDCSIVETSSSASLDGQSCAIIRERARFKPSTDSLGKPVKSAFHQRVTWRIH